ncbi:unnamed protein product [Absidia cylindrospora]
MQSTPSCSESTKVNYELVSDLLNRMVCCLRERSLCDKVFVSSSCYASDSLVSRDVNRKTNVLSTSTSVDGNIQDMISYISTEEQNLCLVTLDFAGLSTDVNDLHSFIRKHGKLKMIIVDNLPSDQYLMVVLNPESKMKGFPHACCNPCSERVFNKK